MTNAELNAMLAEAHQLPKIAKELERMNKLKALELKLQYGAPGIEFQLDRDLSAIMES